MSWRSSKGFTTLHPVFFFDSGADINFQNINNLNRKNQSVISEKQTLNILATFSSFRSVMQPKTCFSFAALFLHAFNRRRWSKNSKIKKDCKVFAKQLLHYLFPLQMCVGVLYFEYIEIEQSILKAYQSNYCLSYNFRSVWGRKLTLYEKKKYSGW